MSVRIHNMYVCILPAHILSAVCIYFLHTHTHMSIICTYLEQEGQWKQSIAFAYYSSCALKHYTCFDSIFNTLYC